MESLEEMAAKVGRGTDAKDDPAEAFEEWFRGTQGSRSLTYSAELTQEEIDRQDYPEGSPERAYLDWIGFPRPSFMKEGN